jgi:hypothetical protein
MMARAFLLTALVASACGGTSTADIKEARESVYQADKQVVWAAMKAEMTERFGVDIKVENEEAGYLESKWRRVDSATEQAAGESNLNTGQMQGAVQGRSMFRMLMKMEGGPPWKIHVDGEGAQYRPDMSMLTPYKHGDIDEPGWVAHRIDAARAGVHRRLKQYAIKNPAP